MFGNDLVRTYNHDPSEEHKQHFMNKRDELIAYLESEDPNRQLPFQAVNIPGMREETYRDLKRLLDNAIQTNQVQEVKEDINLLMVDMWYDFTQMPNEGGGRKSKRKSRRVSRKRKVSRKHKKSSK